LADYIGNGTKPAVGMRTWERQLSDEAAVRDGGGVI